MARKSKKRKDARPINIFHDVKETFLQSMSERERLLFESFMDADSMLVSIHAIVQANPIHETRLTACFDHVRNLAQRISPFFEVCGIFVNSHPEYAALAWGAVRLVFLLGSVHVTFLEKICEMFSHMQKVLPVYEEVVEKLQSRVRRNDGVQRLRIATALGFVYSDLMQFCSDACNIFCKRKSVLGLKWPIAATIFWQPFDTRFELIINRFKEHKELMSIEMAASTQIHVLKVSEALDRVLDNNIKQAKVQKDILKSQKSEAMERRLESLRNWIHAPSWLNAYESVEARRIPETSEWFIRSLTVQKWLQLAASERTKSEWNILSIEGKPGYGKTTLCTALISHLMRESLSPIQPSSNIVFFYFDQQSERAYKETDVFRAILAQLLQLHGGSDTGIDIASLIWYSRRSGQQVASDQEILVLLNLICNQTDNLILLLDGLDECFDARSLFASLTKIGENSLKHSVAFFARPTVTWPKSWSKPALKMTLKSEQNLDDLQKYTRRRIEDMLDDDILAEDTDIDKTVTAITSRANGMFLWVSLLIEYLYLAAPALTMNQRLHTIEELNRLEGLDALYEAILYSLLQKYSGSARTNILRLFQWVLCAGRPLLANEFECAMAVPLDRALEANDTFPDFSSSISRISGALLEIGYDNTIRFIHLSALEYFRNLDDPSKFPIEMGVRQRKKSLSGPDAQLYCATACMSYLRYTVKAGPLSGMSQISTTADIVRQKYTLLDYTGLYFFHHMLCAMSVATLNLDLSDQQLFVEFSELAKSFLSNRELVTTWIEACWTLQGKQNTFDADKKLLKITAPQKTDYPAFQKAFEDCKIAMIKLAQNLTNLSYTWGKVLSQTPHEIWEPSISGFSQSDIWHNIPGSKVTAFGAIQEPNRQQICINSRVSADGNAEAVIRVQPPDDKSETSITIIDTVWTVFYEIWAINPVKMIASFSFDIPSRKVPFSYVWEQNSNTEEKKALLEFLFPTTLSADLRHATFLNLAATVVVDRSEDSLRGNAGSSQKVKLLTQELDISLKTEPSICGSFNFPWEDFHPGFWTHMSDSGRYLLVLHLIPLNSAHRVDKPSEMPRAKAWFVRVYEHLNFDKPREPQFKLLSAIAFVPDKISQIKDRPFTFHPELPLLVFASSRTAWIQPPDGLMGMSIVSISKPKVQPHEVSTDGDSKDPSVPIFKVPAGAQTHIWNFAIPGTIPICIGSLMSNIQFSNDGHLVYGTLRSKRVVVSMPYEKLGIYGLLEPHGRNMQLIGPGNEVSLFSKASLVALSNGPAPPTQQANTLVVKQDGTGQPLVRDLHQSREHGALVLRTLHGDTITHETITRIPRWIDEESEATLLGPTHAADQDISEQTRVVLNRASEPFKKFRANDPPFVPVLIERENNTIPSMVERADFTLMERAAKIRGVLESSSYP